MPDSAPSAALVMSEIGPRAESGAVVADQAGPGAGPGSSLGPWRGTGCQAGSVGAIVTIVPKLHRGYVGGCSWLSANRTI